MVLDKPLTNSEFLQAAKALASKKSLGRDGMPIEFHTKFCPLIGQGFLTMVQESLFSDSLPSSVTTSIKILLHKGDEKELIDNWRPITLLNSSYKIIAKTLQFRLPALFPQFIDPDQTAFVFNRYILENVVDTHEVIKWANILNHDLTMLRLDFRKGYDII